MDKLGLLFSVVSVLSGTTLLYDSVSEVATSPTARLLTGATLLSLGLFTAFYVVKSWRRWRKYSKGADPSEIEWFNSSHGCS